MPNLHFLLLFEGANVNAQLLDSVPEAALIYPKDLGRLDLDATGSVQRLDDQSLFNFLKALVDAD